MISGSSSQSPADPSVVSHEELHPSTASALCGRMVVPGIPPKSKREMQEHWRQIEKLKKQERKRMEKEAKRVKKDRAAETSAISLWQSSILPTFEEARNKPSTISLWKQGLPSLVRGAVWKEAIGNPRGITEEVFQICKSKAMIRADSPRMTELNAQFEARLSPTKQLTASGDPSRDVPSLLEQGKYDGDTFFSPELGKWQSAQQIAVDLPRTFATCVQRQESIMLDALDGLLRMIVEYRPDIGYVQGMSYLGGMLLYHMTEKDAFVALATLLSHGHLPHFYAVNQDGMAAHIAVLNDMIALMLPALSEHLKLSGITPHMFIMEWWMTLFAKNFSHNMAVKSWDLYLLDHAYLYKISLAILAYFEYRLLDAPMEDMMAMLTHLPNNSIIEEKFWDIVHDDSKTLAVSEIHRIMNVYLQPHHR